MAVTVGTKFHSVHGDSNAQWEVVEKRGEGVWDCAIVADDPDYAGVRKPFDEADIERSIRASKFFAEKAGDLNAFWKGIPVGTVMHADLGWGKFVRGVAVKGETPNYGKGIYFKGTALVGAWGGSDLPKWHDSGFQSSGASWIANIDKGSLCRFNRENIYESAAYVASYPVEGATDPTVMLPVDLDAPEPTEGQRETIMLNRAYNEMLNALKTQQGDHRTYTCPEDYAADYRARFEKVAEILAGVDIDIAPANDAPAPRR